jgi:hypothetical protein
MKLVRIFFTGLFISFLGTLPLGTLNIAAMQIAVSDGVAPALYFVLGALIIEIIYVRISLVGMADRINYHSACHIELRRRFTAWRTQEYIIIGINKQILAGGDDECREPGADTILVWLEHCIIYQKNS